MTSDRGGIVLGWLTRLAVVLGVLGVIGYDLISITSVHVTTADIASRAALSASEQWESSHSIQQAYDAAESTAEKSGAQVLTKGFTADEDGTVHLRVRKEATTVVVRHIGPLRSWATIVAAGDGRAVT